MAPGDTPGIEKEDPLDDPQPPSGRVPPPGAGFAVPGLSGVPLPGDPLDADPAKNKPQPPPPAPAAQGIELNLVGSFPNPWRSDPATELAQVKAKKWFPSTDDFSAVAGRGAVVVPSVWAFLLAIVKSGKPIQRLNFFSHGITGGPYCQGAIDPSNGSVQLGTTSDATWGQIFGKPTAIATPYATSWGDLGENSSTEITLDTTKLTLNDVRKKFVPGAQLWLYLCHGASDPLLIQQIANAFQVTTKGFDKTIVYCVPDDFPRNRKHKMAPQTTTNPEDSCANAVLDFKALDSHSAVKTFAPKSGTP